jgi:membrane protein
LFLFLRRTRIFLRYFARRLYNKWTDDNVYFSAAAISFNFLVTALPLGLLLFTFTGFAFRGSGEVREALQQWLEGAGALMPPDLVSELEAVFFSGTGITGLIGLLSLFWLVSRLFGTIRTALDRILDAPSGRNPILGKLYDILLAAIVTVCFLSAFFMTTVASIVRDSPMGRVAAGWPLVGGLIGTGPAKLIGAVFVLLLFFTLFWAAPNRRVSLRQAGAATVLATLFSILGTRLFLYSISRPNWGVVYGSLAALMGTFLWLYLICVILLASAEVSQIIKEWLGIRRTVRGVGEIRAWVDTVAE